MFKLELSDNKIFKDIFDTVSGIVDEVVLECDSEGMRLRCLDRSHITFVNLELKASFFDDYICDTPEKISIDTDEFNKVLKRAKTKDVLGLTSDEGNFVITFIGDSTRTFRIRLIDLEYETPTPPRIDYNVEVELPTEVFTDALSDIEVFGERITIDVDEDYVSFNSFGEFGDTESKYLHGQVISEHVRSVFSLDKLKDIMKARKVNNIIDLFIGNDAPLTLKFEIGNDDGELGFLLAPRLETEE